MYVFYYSLLSVPEMFFVVVLQKKSAALYLFLKMFSTALHNNTEQIVAIILSMSFFK